MIKTALLTIGNSPIADAMIRALAKHSRLECIVVSRKKRRASLAKRIRNYGLRYSLHALVGKICHAVSGQLEPRDFAAGEIIVWDDKLTTAEVLEKLNGVDVLVCCLFNRLLDQSFIESFDYCVNVHPSLLPDYRGPEPIYWGLLHKERQFGISIHHMSDHVDEGDVILQRRIGRPRFPLAYRVEKKLASTVDDAVQEFMEQVARGQVSSEKQGDGFYLPAPTLENIRKFKSAIAGKTA